MNRKHGADVAKKRISKIDRIIAGVQKEPRASWEKNLLQAERSVISEASSSTHINDLLDSAGTLGVSGCGLMEWEALNEEGQPWVRFERFEALAALSRRFNSVDDIGSVSAIGLQLYSALASGREERVAFLTQVGMDRLLDDEDFRESGESSRAAMFALWLGCLVTKNPLQSKVPLESPFAELAKKWTKPADLRPVADYHVEQLDDDGEFCSDWYELIPVELAAVRRVRDSIGLETIWPSDHPLVTNAVAQGYLSRKEGEFEAHQDEIFKIVVDGLLKAKRIPGDVDPWRV